IGPGSAAQRFALRSILGTSGALLRLGLLLHVGSQHRIHPALIALALALEIIEHIFIDTNGDRLFFRRYDQNGVGPVEIDRHRVGIVGDSLGNVLVRQGVDARPVSLALTPIAPSPRYNFLSNLFLHFSDLAPSRLYIHMYIKDQGLPRFKEVFLKRGELSSKARRYI